MQRRSATTFEGRSGVAFFLLVVPRLSAHLLITDAQNLRSMLELETKRACSLKESAPIAAMPSAASKWSLESLEGLARHGPWAVQKQFERHRRLCRCSMCVQRAYLNGFGRESMLL